MTFEATALLLVESAWLVMRSTIVLLAPGFFIMHEGAVPQSAMAKPPMLAGRLMLWCLC